MDGLRGNNVLQQTAITLNLRKSAQIDRKIRNKRSLATMSAQAW